MRFPARITTMAALATLVLSVAAFAAQAPHTPLSSSTPLLTAWVVDDGRSVPAQLECAGTRQTANGPAVVVRNAGDKDAFLTFKNGAARLLAPGQELEFVGADAVASASNKCVCKCTCTSTDGTSSPITFDCASSTGADQCPTSNNSDCSYFDSGNKLHSGTTSGCKRSYIPIVGQPVSVDPSEP